jgi:hypothetical protein
MSTFYFRKIMFVLVLASISCSLQSCLVSRCERPKITGYIYDSDSQTPIEKCRVGETFSNADGYFELDEKRYRQFTLYGFEAPILSVNEKVEKEGFESQNIQFITPHGGGAKKGALHNADTLYLKKVMKKTN